MSSPLQNLTLNYIILQQKLHPENYIYMRIPLQILNLKFSCYSENYIPLRELYLYVQSPAKFDPKLYHVSAKTTSC